MGDFPERANPASSEGDLSLRVVRGVMVCGDRDGGERPLIWAGGPLCAE